MRARFHPGVLFTLAWIVFFVFLLSHATEWPNTARRFPVAIGSAAVVLGLVQLGIDIFRMWRPKVAGDVGGYADIPVDADVPIRVVFLRGAGVLGWILGYVAAIWLVGFLWATPLFVLVFVWSYVRDRWWMAPILAACMGIFTYVLFDRILSIPWPTTVLEALLAG